MSSDNEPSFSPGLYGVVDTKKRVRPGQGRFFNTPEELIAAANEYFDAYSANPYKQESLFHYKGSITSGSLDVPRPYSQLSMCVFLGISTCTYLRYQNGQRGDDFAAACELIDDVIKAQKLEGALLGIYNANIAARMTGLADRVDTTSNGRHVADPPEEMDEEALRKELEARGLPTDIFS